MIIFETFDKMGSKLFDKSIASNITDKPKNNKKNDFIVLKKLEDNHVRYLALPTHRFAKSRKIIILDNNEYSYYRLMMVIYNFYNEQEVTYEDLKNIDDDDVYDIITNLAKDKKKNPDKKIYYRDIQGAKNYMENIFINIDKSGDTQYYLLLGS